jgi:hypothetical protein
MHHSRNRLSSKIKVVSMRIQKAIFLNILILISCYTYAQLSSDLTNYRGNLRHSGFNCISGGYNPQLKKQKETESLKLAKKFLGIFGLPATTTSDYTVLASIYEVINCNSNTTQRQFKCGWEKILYYQNLIRNNTATLKISPVSPSLVTSNMGFFCQKELMLDKITPLPIRFRLGSLDYVNWMEQKPNAIKPAR